MAESSFVLFKHANWPELCIFLDGYAPRSPPDRLDWAYPEPENYRLLLYSYENLEDELEDEDKLNLRAALGGPHSAALCIEFRRSQQERASDDAVSLTVELLKRFEGVADDAHDTRLWTLEQILAAEAAGRDRYLDVYGRSGRRTTRFSK